MKVSYPYYFGCRIKGEAGHYLFIANAHGLQRALEVPYGFDLGELDQGFMPYKIRPHDDLDALTDSRQGLARLSHTRGNTVLSFCDRTGDSRPGSHSTFLLPGTLTFDKAVAAARAAFPMVFERFGFGITKWESPF